MFLVYGFVGVIVIMAIGFLVFINMGSGEAKTLKGALAQEAAQLEKLSYDDLEALVKKEPKVQLSYGNIKLNRSLSSGVVDQGAQRSLRVRIIMTGTVNSSLEESSVITKRKDLSKVA